MSGPYSNVRMHAQQDSGGHPGIVRRVNVDRPGSLFDRIGIRTMILATVASAAAAPLVFLGNFPLAVLGMACWGVGTGAQESIIRATVSRLAPQQRRAAAFGIMNAVYGFAWFAGSVLLGVLYDFSLVAVALASALLQAAALPIFFRLAAR